MRRNAETDFQNGGKELQKDIAVGPPFGWTQEGCLGSEYWRELRQPAFGLACQNFL